MSSFDSYFRQFRTALRFLLTATVVLGLGYPATVWGVGQLAAPAQANGSLVPVDGAPAASALLAQSPQDGLGAAWFHPRPSAAKWDPAASGASNLGPNDPALATAMAAARAEVARLEGVPESQVPSDAVTASASGLDPQISPAYADLQVPRIAQATGLSPDAIRTLIVARTSSGLEALLGQPSVNVTLLNLDLARLEAARK
ncbi:K(+)-transporting ATPase subunit C [Psychromicrobium xiongbiense]|uniref:K(+)-transporting ATPase subunit C n=1 Tax=Psychromicrobium xiongbiense TaxID=3051184 RepID=UPI0025556CC2|nr:K(+)-transporting ATPase subunit C [Psychromicrobium sp. YIM S02556]